MRSSLFALALTLGCVSDPAAELPCNAEGRCLPGHNCVEQVCVPCAADACETSLVTLLSTGGGLACGADETCVRFPAGALVDVTEIDVGRTNLPTTSLGVAPLSKVFSIRPASLLPLAPVEVTFKVSRQVDLADGVAIYRTLDPNGTWEPLSTRRESQTLARATTDGLGFFALGRSGGVAPRPDGGVGGDAGPPPPPTNPIPGMGPITDLAPGMGLHGLAWDPTQQRMFLADQRVNRVFFFDHSGAVPGMPVTYRMASAGTYGLAIDPSGGVVMTEFGGRAISLGSGIDQATALVQNYNGMRLNGPADAAVRGDRTIYFTDPRTGLNGAQPELGFNGVFRRTPTGTVIAEWEGPAAAEPRGIELSPDEHVIYVADAASREIRAWDVGANGGLSNLRVLATTQAATPDGLAVDVSGNLYVGTAMGIEIFSPTGERWGLVARATGAQGLAFGGPGLRTLYVTSGTFLASGTVTSPGAR